MFKGLKKRWVERKCKGEKVRMKEERKVRRQNDEDGLQSALASYTSPKAEIEGINRSGSTSKLPRRDNTPQSEERCTAGG